MEQSFLAVEILEIKGLNERKLGLNERKLDRLTLLITDPQPTTLPHGPRKIKIKLIKKYF